MLLSILFLLINIADIYCVRHGLYKIPLDSYSSENLTFEHLESPVWDENSQTLLFVDTSQQNIHRLDIYNEKLYTKHIEQGQVNVVSLVQGSSRLLVAVGASLFLVQWGARGEGDLRPLVALDQGSPDNVINEGKADALGRFWTGTKGPQRGDDVTPNKATFYSISQADFTHPRIQLRPVSVSNGLTWSHNNSVMYYIDSPTRKIEAFDFDLQKGEISARRTIIDISDYGYTDAIPDGMTIDINGHLWVAVMFGGTIIHIDPDRRKVIDQYLVPVKRTTSVCWGGPNLEHLFITSGRDKSTKSTQNASIYILADSGSRGTPHYKFRFDNADKLLG